MFTLVTLKKLLPVFGALALFGLALLCQNLDAAGPTEPLCTAGIRGVVETLA